MKLMAATISIILTTGISFSCTAQKRVFEERPKDYSPQKGYYIKMKALNKFVGQWRGETEKGNFYLELKSEKVEKSGFYFNVLSGFHTYSFNDKIISNSKSDPEEHTLQLIPTEDENVVNGSFIGNPKNDNLIVLDGYQHRIIITFLNTDELLFEYKTSSKAKNIKLNLPETLYVKRVVE